MAEEPPGALHLPSDLQHSSPAGILPRLHLRSHRLTEASGTKTIWLETATHHDQLGGLLAPNRGVMSRFVRLPVSDLK